MGVSVRRMYATATVSTMVHANLWRHLKVWPNTVLLASESKNACVLTTVSVYLVKRIRLIIV